MIIIGHSGWILLEASRSGESSIFPFKTPSLNNPSRRYEIATKHDCITAPSLLSEAHLSVRPYLAYSSELLRERINQMVEKNSGTWYFDLGKRQGMTAEKRNRITVGGRAKDNFRARYARRDTLDCLVA